MTLPTHDHRHLEAAEGWLELGNVQEAHNELEEIGFANRTHNRVLETRVKLYALAGNWDHVEIIADSLTNMCPESSFGYVYRGHALRKLKRSTEALTVLKPATLKFPEHWKLAFEAACANCQLGDLDSARNWLAKAIEVAGSEDIRLMALDEPDLKPLWQQFDSQNSSPRKSD